MSLAPPQSCALRSLRYKAMHVKSGTTNRLLTPGCLYLQLQSFISWSIAKHKEQLYKAFASAALRSSIGEIDRSYTLRLGCLPNKLALFKGEPNLWYATRVDCIGSILLFISKRSLFVQSSTHYMIKNVAVFPLLKDRECIGFTQLQVLHHNEHLGFLSTPMSMCTIDWVIKRNSTRS